MPESGQQLSHYRLTEKLGEGGMGVVWKALDANLDREVAIKILPDAVSRIPDRLARFDREAKLLATLNHPNIATVFGFHEAGGTHFLAMELVEGEDLAQRLERGALPVVDVLETARQIADGLAAAHEKGVIHRDLKPANVKRAGDGTVKVLDFGLAKSVESGSAEEAASLSMSPTMTSAGSMAGMILGTVGYMSPEQARGKPVDARTDVWAFGCLLYEMLTGRRLFEGETVSDVLAEVLKTEPDWSRLPAETPPAVRRLLKRCLQRDLQRRLHHMADARLEIDEALADPAPAAETSDAAAPSAGVGKERIAWLFVIAALLAIVAALAFWPRATAPQPVVQSTLMPPEGWDFDPGASPALSPDGRRMAFVARPRPDNDAAAGEAGSLWIRDLASAEARKLAEADTDAYPFWSADGEWIGFFFAGKLNKIEARGGPVIPLCDANDGRGAAWNESGTILFQRRWSEALMKVPAGGGTPELATTLDSDRSHIAHRWPQFLPDGRHFLFYVVSTTNPMSSEYSGIHLGSLDSNETRQLMRSESHGLYARGHVLYRLGTTLMARKFDLSTLEFAGDPTPIATDVTGGAISWGGAQFGVAETDVLVHLQGMEGSLSVLNWRDREGDLLETLGRPVGYWDPAISHDGTRLAIGIGVDTVDLWIYDLEQDTQTRVTFDPTEHRNPVWSPDDKQLAFLSSREAEGEIWMRSTSGHGGEQRLFTANTDIVLTDWSSDGRLIFFNYLERSNDSMDVWILDVETAEAQPLISGEHEQLAARQSPDGKWLAFVSDESGNGELYVQTFPSGDERWMVSSDGGARWAWNPIWRNDGRELYFLRGRTLMAVPVTPGAGFPFGAPKPLFAAPVKSNQGNIYAVSQDGQRILVNEIPPADPSNAGARLIQGWSELASR